ncbi:MAG: hypothetical protein ACYTX0_44000 [Nostoc sp.]
MNCLYSVSFCVSPKDIKAALELLELSADKELLQEAQTNLTQLQQELEIVEIQQLLSSLSNSQE